MESSVRYIPMKNAGVKPALCFRGEKIAYAVINDEARVRCLEVSLPDHDKAAFVKRLGHNYLPQAFASAMRRLKGIKQITKRALQLIEEGDKLDPDQKLDPEVIDGEATIKVPVQEITKKGSLGKLDPLGMEAGLQAIAESGSKKGGKAAIGTPRRADKGPLATPIAPLPSKAAPSARKEAKAKPTRGAGVKTLVSILSAEAGLAQQPCRVKLRAAGLRAPYDEKNEDACRKALGLPPKGRRVKV